MDTYSVLSIASPTRALASSLQILVKLIGKKKMVLTGLQY
jgi:hypothetical protein